ncbi:ABC transporter permease [Actinoallomurus rhizosphaericola]|uniref:ABC transporter permease n=1 Tax=Actinoallomurus rhizosphaericola TaxID=2952536 RepID=UPI002093911A|nr:ABC transporter permease [Actinoallomurus rhizosphaericola]MCO5996844.1 ABC transporter permease [Actinoallomurus rhizosphaericola]
MSVTTTAAPSATTPRSAFGRLVVTELKLFVRERIGPIWGVGFPLLLLVIFGGIHSFRKPRKDFGGATTLEIYVPVLIAFSIAMLALSALPMVLAGYREKGVLRRLRTTPMGPVRLLAAQLAVNAAVTVVAVVAILVVARVAYGVALPKQPVGFVIAVLLAAAALMAVGLFVAATAASGRAAQAIGTILFFPMMFFAGLWVPIAQMPPLLRHISHGTPLGPAVQALRLAAEGHWPHPQQLLVMAAYAVVFGLAASRLFRWE